MFKPLIAAAVLVAAAIAAHAQPVLRFANFIPAKAAYSPVFQEFADAVNRDAAGSVRIDVFHGGTLGPNSGQQLKLLEDGVAQIAFFVPAYTAGRFPELEATELPFLVNTSREGAQVLGRLHARGALPSLKGFKVLGLVTTYRTTLHTRTPVRRLEDAKGLRLRVSGALSAEAVKQLGAIPVQMGGGEVMDALSRGVIDGVVGEPYFIATYKMEEIAKAHLGNSIGAITLVVAMLEEEFNKLPPAARAAIDKHAGQAFSTKWATWLDAGNAEVVEKFRQRRDNTVQDLEPAEFARWQAAMKPVLDTWVARRPQNARILADLQKELADARAGK